MTRDILNTNKHVLVLAKKNFASESKHSFQFVRPLRLFGKVPNKKLQIKSILISLSINLGHGTHISSASLRIGENKMSVPFVFILFSHFLPPKLSHLHHARHQHNRRTLRNGAMSQDLTRVLHRRYHAHFFLSFFFTFCTRLSGRSAIGQKKHNVKT